MLVSFLECYTYNGQKKEKQRREERGYDDGEHSAAVMLKTWFVTFGPK